MQPQFLRFGCLPAGITVLSEQLTPCLRQLSRLRSDAGVLGCHLAGSCRASLPSYLRSNRQICASAELQGPILLAAAGAESDSGDYRREYDHALHVHGLLSYHVFGNRTYWLPGCDAQIKNAAAYPEVFHAG